MEAIQACMDGAVKDGLVTPDKPIKFTDWEVVRYDDIPQQNDGYVRPPKLFLADTSKFTKT